MHSCCFLVQVKRKLACVLRNLNVLRPRMRFSGARTGISLLMLACARSHVELAADLLRKRAMATSTAPLRVFSSPNSLLLRSRMLS